MKIPFCKSTVGQEEIDAVSRVMASGWMAAGKETEAFEKEFAEYVGVKYAIYTNSGTSALKMAYKYFKEEEDCTHYSSPENTFCATYSAAEETGLTRDSAGDGIGTVKSVVHYGGVKETGPCDIEDSAHRIEPNDPLIGKIRTYSFYVTKNMTTGSGGMFVTNDKEIYEKARDYWKDGISSSTYERQLGRGYNYDVVAMAGGYDGNDIGAAIGRVQLQKLPSITTRRNAIVKRYNKEFKQDWSGNHLYPFFVQNEEEVHSLIEHLNGSGVATGYHYPSCGWLGVSLPIFPGMTDEEVQYTIDKTKEWLSKHQK